MLKTYVVEGGIGKCVAFSALIPKLKERDGEDIQIYTPYIDVFSGNPDVKWVIDQNTVPYQDERIQASDEIVFCEPYKSNFVKGEKHLIQAYADLLGVDYDPKKDKPKLYTDQLKADVDKLLSENNINKFIIVQFSGGQSPINFNGQNQYMSIDPGRNYHPFLATQLIQMIKQQHPDLTIFNFSLPNEPNYEGTLRPEIPFTVWHELLKKAETFVSIDSSLQHFSASAEKKGVVLWGSTGWNQLGYSHNVNMNYFMKDTWEKEKFISVDPRNLMVDPATVAAEVTKLIKKDSK